MSNSTIKYGVRDGITWIHPINRTYISSGFGYRWHPTTGEWTMHKGVDLKAPKGTEVRASREGRVTVATFQDSAGNYVVIKHGTSSKDGVITEDGYKSVYMHLTHYVVKVGDHVKAGQLIGYVGSTGRSTGPHLHFGIYVDATNKHLTESVSDNSKYQKGNDIYVDPNLFAKFSSGYKEGNLSEIPGTSTPVVWIEKQVPSYDDWSPMLPNYSYKVQNNSQIGNLLSRRGHLISNSSKVLFENGRVNQNIGLGYNFVGMNSYHPTVGTDSGATVAVDTDMAGMRLHINRYISRVNDSYYKKGELSRDNQNIVASYILSYLCSESRGDRRWTPNAVIGMLGNMVGESGLNPARWEGDVTQTVDGVKKGFGLVQWTPWNKHRDWCKNNGRNYDPYDIDGQLEHIQDEFFGAGGQYYILTNSKYVHGYYNQFSKDPFYTGEVRNYIDSKYLNESRLVPISRGDFPKSLLPPEILAVGFATNYERPAIKYIHTERRVQNAKRFAELFGENHYEVRIEIPSSDISSLKSYWIPRGVTNGGVNGTNPYLSNSVVHISYGGDFINNAYAWGRAVEILHSYKESADIYATLCSDSAGCWFDYNKNENYYEYDKMPRVGSIICWEYRDHSNSSDTEKSYVGVVEEVLGSDVIKISKMDSSSGFTLVTIDNGNNNWGLNKSTYMFKGFIHLLPQNVFYPNMSLSEDGSLHVQCSSNTGESYASVLFGLTDIKHFNRMKIEYDLEICPPSDNSKKIIDNTNEPLSIILDRLDDYCNFYVYMSQQVISCTPESAFLNESWPGTYFPNIITEENGDDNVDMGSPFPDGVVLLSSYSKNDLTDMSKFKLLNNSYVFTNMSKTIQLNRCVYDGIGGVPTFGEDTKVRKLNREKQTYIGLSVVSAPAEIGDIRYETSVKLIIKKIILYG